MSKVEPIEKNLPHTVSEVICVFCGHRWISVRPTSVLLKHIECPCGRVGGVIETGQPLEHDEERR